MGDDGKPRDGWDKADIIAKILGSVLLPIVLAVVGSCYTRQQQQADEKKLAQQREADQKRLDAQRAVDEAQRDTDRVTTLLKFLGSPSEQERFLGTNFVRALADQGRVPLGLAQVIFAVSQDDQSARVRQTAGDAFAELVKAHPETLLGWVRGVTANPRNAGELKANERLGKVLTDIAEAGPANQQSDAGEALRNIFARSERLSDCGPGGAAPPASPQALMNEIKRHTPSGTAKTLSFLDFRRLQQLADSKGIPQGRGTGLTAVERATLRNIDPAAGGIGEGGLVQVVGFIQSPRAGGRESVNCYLAGAANSDLTLSVTEKADDPPIAGIVAEMIPQLRPSSWSLPALRSVANGKRRVKIVGQLFFDNAHRVRDQPDQPPTDPARMSLWEVHPVTEFLVCVQPDNVCTADDLTRWVSLEKWLNASTH